MINSIKRLLPDVGLSVLAALVLLASDRPQPGSPGDSLPRIAIFQFASRPVLDDCVAGEIEGLRAKGLAADRDIRIQFYNAENDLPTANGMARACRRRAPSSLPGFPIGQK